MKVFVTGGTGVLGRAAIRKLLARGHEVVALAHSDDAVEKLQAAGATAVRGDLFDPDSVRRAMQGADAVLHLATRIPPSSKMRKASAWAENDRLRSEGTRILVDAALEFDVQTFVYPSVTFFYADGGNEWIDKTNAAEQPTSFLRSTLKAEAQVERLTHAGRRGIVLRLGWLYGPDSSHTRETLEYARKGTAAIMGHADAYQSWIWDEDASEALVVALEKAPAGIYDVVDDRPVTRSEMASAMAAAVGRTKLRRLPKLMVRLFTGPEVSEMGSRSQRVSNRRFKAATRWSPEVQSFQQGWQRLVGQ